MDDHIASSRRSDEQLLFTTDQTAEWTVNGRAGVTLGSRLSLREAIRAVFEHEALGHHVFAVCAQPDDAIIVFREQIVRVATQAGMMRVTCRDVAPPGPGGLDRNYSRHRLMAELNHS
jgi:hypothetical protein